MYLISCSAIGALSGILAGMGMGGGTLLIPLLTIFAGVGQRQAQLYNLIAFIPTAAVSLFIHSKNGLVRMKGTAPLIVFAALFSALGAVAQNYIPVSLVKKGFALFLLAVSVWSTFCALKGKKITERKKDESV